MRRTVRATAWWKGRLARARRPTVDAERRISSSGSLRHDCSSSLVLSYSNKCSSCGKSGRVEKAVQAQAACLGEGLCSPRRSDAESTSQIERRSSLISCYCLTHPFRPFTGRRSAPATFLASPRLISTHRRFRRHFDGLKQCPIRQSGAGRQRAEEREEGEESRFFRVTPGPLAPAELKKAPSPESLR